MTSGDVATGRLVGASHAIRAIEQEIDAVGPSDATVLITGESGVGKDIVARLLHDRSGRAGPFVAINCAGVPESLLESELFGYVRGSFTGAYRDRSGRLQQAGSGTIFLDEVGEMSLRMQALLLRFIENGEIQRLGCHQLHTIDNVRVVAATNRNLSDRIAHKQFREDLYYRLNVIRISIPPLRERPEDIVPLLTHFLGNFSAVYQVTPPRFDSHAIASLTAYPWPGNVRELSNVVERLVARNRHELVTAADLFASSSTPILTPAVPAAAASPRPVADVLYERMIGNGENFWTVVHDPFTKHDVTRDDVRTLVARGLRHTRGNYKSLLAHFNVPLRDYKRFLMFLKRHDCWLSFQEYRSLRSFDGESRQESRDWPAAAGRR